MLNEVQKERLDGLSNLNKEDFILLFGSVYEHSDWVAEALYNKTVEFNSVETLKHEMKLIVDNSDMETKLALLRAHPDLAGKAALAGELTDSSTEEQAGAGLDQCTEAELAHFLTLNNSYKDKFGFPFIMAVKGATKAQILEGFISRTPNDRQTEFDTAIQEVHKIAGFRLDALSVAV
ncbi:2-oxo-4-hydroxy-4-carboxy-5-ureidoimidazoline decarboxylase [Marinomonas mediterranea]|uniref:2-oxo-4-hydroxy-4-carboxy-5-ureidoimidazoline decarboxylase n=1 Tax=Marinomonas mediterranea (strain ATCC 700492 / JCM 21426 / NBRC 103028 / MMB-1) TaxID=717774 RepID=F2JXL6_MARM1|nr:2-oxo-4-hydroxy-4-carboxy-5-ureidoimidazoline decarboxylase [Marinomonas mediterranea]ADZ93014.1 OHCU decarboxylase [Marinomonas mediterranea MMB-1]WCN10925.1 2-oxo-4-hydroxy-4-carboxy-5-ureidoimidazoline decarboxylase [Marinomonas mediterranea]WCN19031.1 2-oxo-4-hydroxy-4-carboxy-5-ureidoimidazoline decarboxylase [Marinomonas mediterranea MMB-1]